MKKISLIIFMACVCVFTKGYAQTRDRAMNGPKLGLGLDFAFPAGDFKNRVDYGFGGGLNYQHPLGNHLSITGNVGYLRFNGKSSVSTLKYTEGYVPIKAGAKYYLGENIYATVETGVAISTVNGGGNGTAFIYLPGLGVDLPVSDDLRIDLSIRYENWAGSNGTRSFVGLRAGISF